ncbi:hypothetical protein LTS15_000470 [Exophiala xenobiotica]|nr:hypothetical protein LTS15_000470 [Exophiala xenobiotica]
MSYQQRNLSVGLCGGGLGGLTAAIALARAGARVTVLEAAEELGEIGAGIQMTPNVARFLLRWGVSDIIGPDLVQCDRINMRGKDGQLVAFSDLTRIVRDYGYPWWVVHRHHLHSGLAESCRRHGVQLVIDARVEKIEYDDNADAETKQVKVTTVKGKQYTFDLLVGSDGLKSVVRKKLFPNVKPAALTKNAAYRAVIPYSQVFAKIPEARGVLGNAIDVWQAPGSYFISYPMSAGRDFNMVLSHHTRDGHVVEDVEEADMDELRCSYEHYDPVVQKIVALIPQSKRWPLMVTGPLESWSNKAKNVVLMGDAAHSMVNHMAQGAATSMEDGAFLGKVIADVVRGILTLPEAIEIYEKTRMPRAWTKQQASFTAGQLYMAAPPDLEVRDASSRVEREAAFSNVTSPPHPPPTYRSWDLWGFPDSIPGVYAYDAEADADNAICEYLGKTGEVDPDTRVSKRLKEKWWNWGDTNREDVLTKQVAKARL